MRQDLIKQILDYDPETGQFTWLVDRGPCKCKGKPAGSVGSLGYVSIKINGVQCMAHRAAWVWVHGDISDDVTIDHIDHNPSNNRIANLRLATTSQNGFNRRLNVNNTSGVKGVYEYWKRGKFKGWAAVIKVNTVQYFLGVFPLKEGAISARRAAETKYHGQFANSTGDTL